MAGIGRGLASLSNTRSWPLAVRCSSSGFKDRNVRLNCGVRLHPLLAKERRHRTWTDDAHNRVELGCGLKKLMGCMHHGLAPSRLSLASFLAPLLLNGRNQLSSRGLKRCSWTCHRSKSKLLASDWLWAEPSRPSFLGLESDGLQADRKSLLDEHVLFRGRVGKCRLARRTRVVVGYGFGELADGQVPLHAVNQVVEVRAA